MNANWRKGLTLAGAAAAVVGGCFCPALWLTVPVALGIGIKSAGGVAIIGGGIATREVMVSGMGYSPGEGPLQLTPPIAVRTAVLSSDPDIVYTPGEQVAELVKFYPPLSACMGLQYSLTGSERDQLLDLITSSGLAIGNFQSRLNDLGQAEVMADVFGEPQLVERAQQAQQLEEHSQELLRSQAVNIYNFLMSKRARAKRV